MKDDFEILVEKYADTVTRICFVNLENRADAEDAWQNVFIKLFKSKKYGVSLKMNCANGS